MTDAAGRVAVVTGGAGGLGVAIGKRLAADGDTVVVVDLDAGAAQAVAAGIVEAGGTACGWACDVSSDEANQALIARVGDEFGRLDRLVNNAGIGQQNRFGSITGNEWRRVLDVNLWGPASLCQAAAELWKDQGGAAVVNLTSRTWVAGGPLAYTSSKAGIVGLTRALAVELAPYSVTVNAVAPSTVLTPDVGPLKAFHRRGLLSGPE